METNVIFEKNVFKKLCDTLKNYKQVLIITSPTPKENFLPVFSNMLKERGITFWTYCLPKNSIVSSENILKACSTVKGASAIVSLGAGTVCDVSKIVSTKMNLPCFVVPTTISHFGFFNNFAIYKNPLPTFVKTNFPKGVFIDENIINKSPETFVRSTLCFSISILEHLFNLELRDFLFQEKIVNIEKLKLKIKQIEELTCWLSVSKNFTILNLMDYVFDLSQILKNQDKCSNLLFASMLNSSTLKNNFGERALLCSQTLLNVYYQFLKQNVITPKNTPDREKLIHLLCKTPINSLLPSNFSPENVFDDFINSSNYLLNQKLIFNIQKNKTAFSNLCAEKSNEISKFMKKFKMVFSSNDIRMIDENNLLSSLELLPLFSETFFPKIISRFGYLNVV